MILRVCVVISSHNNPTTVTDVVKDVVLKSRYPVLIVDDGSETPVEGVLYSWDVKKAIESGRVRIVRFPKNRGKGAVLAFAIRDLVKQGFTHMLTMDADGQHLATEIDKLTKVAKSHPWDLIVGRRKLKSEIVPTGNTFSRTFSNFWTAYQTGLIVRDVKSGFRLYPLFSVQNLSFFSHRVYFEIEILMRLIWLGVHVQEVDIDVADQPRPEQRSPIYKLWNHVRLSGMNAALVGISLIRSRSSPALIAASAGLGVFVGCTPFFGFHTLMVMLLAFVLRLNAAALWLGSQVSIPPLAPLVVLSSIYIGGQWLGVKLGAGPLPHFHQWLMGSLVLGAVLGGMTAIVTYISTIYVRSLRARSRDSKWGTAPLTFTVRHLGLQAGYFFLYFIVPYFYVFSPSRRRGLNEYYLILNPQLGYLRRQAAILRHFFRHGQILVDKTYHEFSKNSEFTVRTGDRQHILQQMESRQGSLMLSGHLGSWDMSFSLLNIQGLDVTQPMRKDESDTRLAIRQALSSGRCVGLMGDRSIADQFELIPFLGRLAPIDVTIFDIAAATRVPLLFTFGFKGRGMEYVFYASSARTYEYTPSVSQDLQLYAWTEQFVRELEKFVIQYPDQWFNFYLFWSTRPIAPNGTDKQSPHYCLLEELPLPANLEVGWVYDSRPGEEPQLLS